MKKGLLLLLIMAFTQLTGAAMENKIKFDDETFLLSNPESKTKNYNYYLKDENIENWHTRINIQNLPDKTNATEAAAEFAHRIQSEHPGASVLVYPDAGMVGYLLSAKDCYEYNTVFFYKGKNGLDKFDYSKRFYDAENGGHEGARKAAIEFAEKNNKKYMEMVNKTAAKYKVD